MNLLDRNFISQGTTKVHYLDVHFPMLLNGTTLSFAITLNCRDAIRALRDFRIEPSDLETAVSCHQSDIPSLLWSCLLTRGHTEQLISTFVYSPKGPILIGALAQKSTFERTILHSPIRAKAQSKMIKLLTSSIFDLITHEKRDHRKLGTAAIVTFIELIGEGIEHVLDFGDLEIAIDLRRTITSQELEPHLDRSCRRRIFQAATRVACSGWFDLERSKQILDFARDCMKDEDTDFQILKTMIEHKSESLFRSSLEEGLDVMGCEEDGQGLLHYMINTGFYSLDPIRLLVDKGADPFHASNDGQTPLNLAVKMGLVMVVNEFLSKGANLFAADKNGDATLLHAAQSWNCSPVAETRKICKANIDRVRIIDSNKNREVSVALRTAAKYLDIEMIKILLRNGARTDVKDRRGDVALHYTVQGPTDSVNRTVSCYQFLLHTATDNLPRNEEGDTPLHHAARRYQRDALRDLLNFLVRQLRSDINAQNKRGETILHQAARQTSFKSFAIICEFGAAPSLRDSQGLTAMHLFFQATCRVADFLLFTRRPEKGGLLTTLINSEDDPFLSDCSETARDYRVGLFAGINGNDALFCAVFNIVSRILCRSQCTPSLYDRRTRELWLKPVWSWSFPSWFTPTGEEKWRVLRNIIRKCPQIDARLSLLMWPEGAHMLKYAIAVCDLRLLRRSSKTAHRLPASLNMLKREIQNDFENLATLPRSPGSTSSKTQFEEWSEKQVRYWETSIRCDEDHQDQDPLNGIFDFISLLDRQTLTWDNS